jgi:endonuclease/exonuclease/phosphatase (EEP) superfamily protein YafD
MAGAARSREAEKQKAEKLAAAEDKAAAYRGCHRDRDANHGRISLLPGACVSASIVAAPQTCNNMTTQATRAPLSPKQTLALAGPHSHDTSSTTEHS